MRTIAFSILPLGTFAVAGPAAAQQPAADVPTYDTDAYCEEVSQAVGGSYQIYQTCVAQEIKARDGEE